MPSSPIRATHGLQTTSGQRDVGSLVGSTITTAIGVAELVHRNLEAYREGARGAFSPATGRALRSDSALFAAWCSDRMLSALPAEAATVAGFVDDQAPAKKPATIRRYVRSSSHMRRAADVPNPCDRSVVKLALKRMGKTFSVEQRQAEGKTWRLVDCLLLVGGNSLRYMRNRVVLAMAYDTLAKRSELVSLQLEDLKRQSTATALSRSAAARPTTPGGKARGAAMLQNGRHD